MSENTYGENENYALLCLKLKYLVSKNFGKIYKWEIKINLSP